MSSSHQEVRERLFQRRSVASSSNQTANEAVAIQKSLNRTEALLKQELGRVSQISHSIDDDGRLLNSTMEEHKTMDLKKAKKSLTSLQRAQQREQRILSLSIIFFWSVVVYVLWSRIIAHLPFVESLFLMMRRTFMEIWSIVSDQF